MTFFTNRSTLIVLILAMALPARGQEYFLYTPQPVAPGAAVQPQGGILVKNVAIQKGDTLMGISRKFSGHATYYPQILLFNSIENPNLIYTGKVLKVPVTNNESHTSEQSEPKALDGSHKKKATGGKKTPVKVEAQLPVQPAAKPSPLSHSNTELTLGDLKALGTGKSSTKQSSGKAVTPARKKTSHAPPTVATTLESFPGAHKNSTKEPHIVNSAAGQKLFEAAVKAYRQNDCSKALELLDRYLADNSGSPLAADANLYKADCYYKLSTP